MASAGLGRARAVAVVTSSDLTNIEVAIAVRTLLGPRWGTATGDGVPVVLRIFDRDLAGAVVHRFGFQNVRPTVDLDVPWFVGAALGLHVLGTFSVRGESFMVGRFEVGSGLDSVTMDELSARTRVIAIRRADGSLEHPPRRGTSFAVGDLAYLIGPYAELLALLQRGRTGGAA